MAQSPEELKEGCGQALGASAHEMEVGTWQQERGHALATVPSLWLWSLTRALRDSRVQEAAAATSSRGRWMAASVGASRPSI